MNTTGDSGDDGINELFVKIMQQMKCQTDTRCDQRDLYVFLMGHGFLFVFLMATFGNCVNLLIYNSDQIRFYLAIRMLCTRLLMNSATMIFWLPSALRTVGAWKENSSTDKLYWSYYPYLAYLVNIFGFCAMWITVLMTAECYVHIFYPNHSKSVCTKRNLTKSNIIIMITGAILALNYPLNREATVSVDRCRRVVVNINASPVAWVVAVERVHTVAHLFLAILLPMGLLLFMTLAVVWRLVLRRTERVATSHFTSEKRCVTRITLITTSLQLIAELPQIPVFLYGAISGPQVINEPAICTWHTIAMFLGLCNMSLSFFVYLALSQKFRQMVHNRLSELCSRFIPCVRPTIQKNFDSDRFSSRTLVSQQMRPSNSRRETLLLVDRSTAEDAFL